MLRLLRTLGRRLRGWIQELVPGPRCPSCQRELAGPPPGCRRSWWQLAWWQGGGHAFCQACSQRLGLPGDGLRGRHPLRWWSSGVYGGALRQLLLHQRRLLQPPMIAALTAPLAAVLPQEGPAPWLVPIPSWKRQGNPLPAAICRALGQQRGWRRVDLLGRTSPRIGQHHLNRQQRLENQRDAFRCQRLPRGSQARRRPILLVDDILTTGATLASAAACLEAAGWRVTGAVCLARTPARRQRRPRS